MNLTRIKVSANRRGPSLLGYDELEMLQAKFPFRRGYKYDDQSIIKRGSDRTFQILELPGASEASNFLEIGCGDGMVSAMLNEAGKQCTGIDLNDQKFDPRAVKSGAQLIGMDAEDLLFEDNSFDFIISFNSFEHFSRPDIVFGEMIRVLKPGGFIYLKFAPLYNSAFGEHAYRTITVPYCQFLFSMETMNEYAIRNDLRTLDPSHVNRWPLEDYRKLWTSRHNDVTPVIYHESMNLSHLDVIRKYPECFKEKVKSFENFLVSGITAGFKLA